jgi:hypothetical protein
VEAPIQHRSISDREVQDTPLYAPEERYQKVFALLWEYLRALQVPLGADPLSIQSVKGRRQTTGRIRRKRHVPPNAANLPPRGSANNPLHRVLASKCLYKTYHGFFAGGGGNYKAGDKDPLQRQVADVHEVLRMCAFDRELEAERSDNTGELNMTFKLRCSHVQEIP